MKQKIRIAQLGIGHNHAADKMASLRKLDEYFEVVGVAEDNDFWREQRKNYSHYQGIPFLSEDELLNVPNLDAVAIEKDEPGIIPTAIKAAERKLHIHLDKPAGQTVDGFETLLELCQKNNLAFQQAYIYRYNPAVQFILNAVKQGWLGNIFEIHAVMSRYDGDNQTYRNWLSQFKGGAFYIFAGYLIDLVVQMLGMPTKTTAFLQETRQDGLIDNGLAVLEYPIATATIRVSVEEVDGMKHRRLIVCGTKGTAELCPIEASGSLYYTQPLVVRLTLKHAQDPYPAGTTNVDCGPLGDRYGKQLLELYRVVREGLPNPYSYQHELNIHKVLLNAIDQRRMK